MAMAPAVWPEPNSRHGRVEVQKYPQRVCLVFLFGHLWVYPYRTRSCALHLPDRRWCSRPRAQFAGGFQPRCLWSGEAAVRCSHRLAGRSWPHASGTTFKGVPALWFSHGDHRRILVAHRALCFGASPYRLLWDFYRALSKCFEIHFDWQHPWRQEGRHFRHAVCLLPTRCSQRLISCSSGNPCFEWVQLWKSGEACPWMWTGCGGSHCLNHLRFCWSAYHGIDGARPQGNTGQWKGQCVQPVREELHRSPGADSLRDFLLCDRLCRWPREPFLSPFLRERSSLVARSSQPAWRMFRVLHGNMQHSSSLDLETLWSCTSHAFDFHSMHRPHFLASLWIASSGPRGRFHFPPWPDRLHQAFAGFSGGRLHTFDRTRHVERIFESRCWRFGRCRLAWWDPGRPTWLQLSDFGDVNGLCWISSSIDALGGFGQRCNSEPNRSTACSRGFGPFGWRLGAGGLKMLEIGDHSRTMQFLSIFPLLIRALPKGLYLHWTVLAAEDFG